MTEDTRSLRTGVLASAAVHPNAPAVVVRGQILTYEALALRARVLATAIVRALGRPAARVGVFAARSEVAYVGTLGALCSGAAFVPLNPKLPIERTRFMARRAELDAIIVDRDTAPLLDAVAGDVPVLIHGDQPGEHVPLDDLPAVDPDSLAYLLFTSGTTGEPKGVGITHRNVLHYLDVMGARYGLTADDRCSQTFDQTFDLSVHDLFMTWNAGACLYAMAPIEMLAPARFVNAHQLTSWFSVPSAAVLARDRIPAGSMPSLRWSLFCGEPLTNETAERWQAAAPNSTVENLYGPTELTIACFVYRWDGVAHESVNGIVPIGRPLNGLAARVVDEELLVGGLQTAPGYWRDAAQTAGRFVEGFYRTGDRVMEHPSGIYSYLGRVDHQLKILGFRVEPAEIEGVLRLQPGVTGAVAVGYPIAQAQALGVVAFVTGAVESLDALRRAAAMVLPTYMVPSKIVRLDQFPLNANGKVDRAELLRLAAADETRDPIPVS
ncbi:MAG TPA: AMP-binding protein [Gemmatimonadaceae bacterium]|nr:AMP-binding protein [Gemmatimonadaceae bacterium]